ncbi:hypothetical protein [Gilliamella sp. G0441]|uniref:hypothetical protein n=1 Tax=Gilliamella sp. G0441 TaxID=3384760 RepID=UPI003D34022B
MKNEFYLLKGTVSHLRKGEKDIVAFPLICSIIAFFCYLFGWCPQLNGKYFFCFVGNKQVDGRLTKIAFNDGDYVEIIVKPTQDDTYQAYAVRIPQQHAIIFPHPLGASTLELLELSFIMVSIFIVPIFLLLLIVGLCDDASFAYYFSVIKNSFWGWSIAIILFFFWGGGGYSFFSNKIFSCLGYLEPWRYSAEKETKRFKKLHYRQDSEIFNDPQTPDFQRLKIFKGKVNYYCRTPILPDWLKVIDERSITNKNKT